MQKYTRVKVLKLFNDGNKQRKPGEIVDIPNELLAHYMRFGKVTPYVEEKPKPVKKVEEKPKQVRKRRTTKKSKK